MEVFGLGTCATCTAIAEARSDRSDVAPISALGIAPRQADAVVAVYVQDVTVRCPAGRCLVVMGCHAEMPIVGQDPVSMRRFRTRNETMSLHSYPD